MAHFLYEYKLTKTTNKVSIDSNNIKTSSDAFNLLYQIYEKEGNLGIYESFYIVFLNRANKPVGYACIGKGGITSTLVDIKIICKYAIESLCTSVILAHNHPAGSLKPSESDINLTKNIKKSLEVFDISILDHIILSDECSYYSLADNFDLNF